MNGIPEFSPGTVSKILWHFTGGPTWNPKTKKQNISPKPSGDAYENLKSILQTKELRLGNYKEIIKVIIPERKKFNVKKRTIEIEKNVPVEITSSSICCLSDIPAPHLRYHAYRYGKFAIGFHRSSVIQKGFNPVFYTLQDTPVVRSIYEGFSSLDFADPWEISLLADSMKLGLSDIESRYNFVDVDVATDILNLEAESDSIGNTIKDAKKSLQNFVAFVKTFEATEFSTIYCEREWRSTNPYKFNIDNVAMIVLPRQVSKTRYFQDFVDVIVPKFGLPRRIPVVPWEDLVEH